MSAPDHDGDDMHLLPEPLMEQWIVDTLPERVRVRLAALQAAVDIVSNLPTALQSSTAYELTADWLLGPQPVEPEGVTPGRWLSGAEAAAQAVTEQDDVPLFSEGNLQRQIDSLMFQRADLLRERDEIRKRLADTEARAGRLVIERDELREQADVHRAAADDSQRLFRRMYGDDGPCLSPLAPGGESAPCVLRSDHDGAHRNRHGTAWAV